MVLLGGRESQKMEEKLMWMAGPKPSKTEEAKQTNHYKEEAALEVQEGTVTVTLEAQLACHLSARGDHHLFLEVGGASQEVFPRMAHLNRSEEGEALAIDAPILGATALPPRLLAVLFVMVGGLPGKKHTITYHSSVGLRTSDILIRTEPSKRNWSYQ
ncbi:hypothetical protein ACHQM5_002289 [Ranunculus cassubicifolius]